MTSLLLTSSLLQPKNDLIQVIRLGKLIVEIFARSAVVGVDESRAGYDRQPLSEQANELGLRLVLDQVV